MKPTTLEWINKAEEDWQVAQMSHRARKHPGYDSSEELRSPDMSSTRSDTRAIVFLPRYAAPDHSTSLKATLGVLTSGRAAQPRRGCGGSRRYVSQGSRVHQPWAVGQNPLGLPETTPCDLFRRRG